ncbi:MAG: Fe(2+)-trafficking protein [Phycisphaerae bacterium]
MDAEERISQFKTMTEADPDNEMGHFSLGKAYYDAGRFAEAEPSLRRVLELNQTHSKTYQLLGHALLELGQRDEAITTLKHGYKIASERGDVMPRDGIAQLLSEAGETLPQVAAPAEAPAASTPQGDIAGFQCSRCGRPNGKLPQRPFKGELGEKIWAGVCGECWREWIGMGTKVINELGLQLADPKAQAIYDEHMIEFLQLPS